MNEQTQAVDVGIDVAKAHVDVMVRPSGQQRRAVQDASGMRETVCRLQELRPALVFLEAAGGYEAPLASASRPEPVLSPPKERGPGGWSKGLFSGLQE